MEKKGLAGVIRRWRNHITWVLKNDLWILEGREKHSGKELALAYAGLERNKNYLTRIAFKEGWKERFLGSQWLWQILPCARRANPSCALLIYETNKDREMFFTFSRLLRSPVWVSLELPITERHDSASVRFKYKDIVRKIRKHSLTYSVSKSEADFDDFYHNLYVPNIQKRHQESGFKQDYDFLKKKFLSHCELTLVWMPGHARPIAGGIVDFSGPKACLYCLGIRDGSEELIKMGAAEAVYYFEIAKIREKGGKVADLGYCRSFFKDGVFRYKLNIGAHVANSYFGVTGFLHFRFLLDTEGVREFLCENPFIEWTTNKTCRGVIFIQEPLPTEELDQALKNRDCKGLRDVNIYTFTRKKVDLIQTIGGYHVRFLPASSIGYPGKTAV